MPSNAAPALAGSLSQAVSWLALAIAAVIALAPPLGFFSLLYTHETASVEVEAELIATQITQLISSNPETWAMQYSRLNELMTPQGLSSKTEAKRTLIDLDDRVVLDVRLREDGGLGSPVIGREATVFDHGHAVGKIEIVHSLRPLIEASFKLGAICLLLALGSYAALRILPLRLLRRAMDRAAWLATHDPLTRLPNRALFHKRLGDALSGARRNGTTVGVFCLDLDHFKEVNDRMGHLAGDRLLCEVAKRLSANLRETDTLARMGADEFAVVQTLATDPRDIESMASRLISLLGEPFDVDGVQVATGGSIGITLSRRGESDASRLQREAELALYQAKSAGRSVFRFYEAEMNERLNARRAMEMDLRQALATGGFQMHYQPQVSLAEGDPVVTGAEALIRWTHPVRGMVPPDRFIPLAEETGLIVPLGDWVLTESCRRAATWPSHLSIAVNVSAVQFRDPGFLPSVRRVLAETGLPGNRLELEITEGVLLTETEDTVAAMLQLREMGVRLAMDDFGTGYSSLGYLRKFRFDKIKIDQSFVRNLGKDPGAVALVAAVIGIGHALGIQANAEGVETEEQAEMLRAEGCAELQGYLYGRPMAAEAFEAMLAATAGGPSARAAA